MCSRLMETQVCYKIFFGLVGVCVFLHSNEESFHGFNLVRAGSLRCQTRHLHLDELPGFDQSLEFRADLHSHGKGTSQKSLTPANKRSPPPPYAYKTNDGKSLPTIAI